MSSLGLKPTPAMVEAMRDLSRGSTQEEKAHLYEMMQAIREQIADERFNHGGFVLAMVDQDYRQAFIRADGTNRRYFGVLVYYREIGIPNNIRETRVTGLDSLGLPRAFETDGEGMTSSYVAAAICSDCQREAAKSEVGLICCGPTECGPCQGIILGRVE